MQLMQHRTTKSASPTHKLHSYSRLLVPIPKLVVPKTNETIKLSETHTLYSWHDRTKHWRALNYCLLIAKYCIFCTSIRDVLDFQCFLLLLNGKLDCEKSTTKIFSHLSCFTLINFNYSNYFTCVIYTS